MFNELLHLFCISVTVTSFFFNLKINKRSCLLKWIVQPKLVLKHFCYYLNYEAMSKRLTNFVFILQKNVQRYFNPSLNLELNRLDPTSECFPLKFKCTTPSRPIECILFCYTRLLIELCPSQTKILVSSLPTAR